MKKKWQRIGNYLLNTIVVVLLIVFVKNQLESRELRLDSLGNHLNLDTLTHVSGEELTVGKPITLIFWASWCRPCMTELNRVSSAIESGDISRQDIVAISVDETVEAVLESLSKVPFPFPVYFDSQKTLARSIRLQATPTLVFVDDNHDITDMTSGMSLFLISKIQSHAASQSSTE